MYAWLTPWKRKRGEEMRVFNALIKKHNEKKTLKNGLIHCAWCKRLILKTDKYCQYCGKSRKKVRKNGNSKN